MLPNYLKQYNINHCGTVRNIDIIVTYTHSNTKRYGFYLGIGIQHDVLKNDSMNDLQKKEHLSFASYYTHDDPNLRPTVQTFYNKTIKNISYGLTTLETAHSSKLKLRSRKDRMRMDAF